MKPTWAIGDLHGDVDLMRFIIKQAKKRELIFFGDLVDSFVFGVPEQLACVEEMLKLIKKGRAQCLLGNHEMSYLLPDWPGAECSGWSKAMHFHLMPLKSDILKLFKPFIYYQKEKALLSHAGLTNQLFDLEQLTLSGLGETLQNWYDDGPQVDDSPYWWIGQCRYGRNSVGGLLWNDWNNEHQPVPNITQIMGHTPINKITKYKGDWNIDCLQHSREVLEWSGAKRFQVVTL